MPAFEAGFEWALSWREEQTPVVQQRFDWLLEQELQRQLREPDDDEEAATESLAMAMTSLHELDAQLARIQRERSAPQQGDLQREQRAVAAQEEELRRAREANREAIEAFEAAVAMGDLGEALEEMRLGAPEYAPAYLRTERSEAEAMEAERSELTELATQAREAEGAVAALQRCSVCMDGPPQVVLIPCGHWVCLDCGLGLRDGRCPTCRADFYHLQRPA